MDGCTKGPQLEEGENLNTEAPGTGRTPSGGPSALAGQNQAGPYPAFVKENIDVLRTMIKELDNRGQGAELKPQSVRASRRKSSSDSGYPRRAKLPPNVRVYEGNKDSEDYLSIFSAVAEQEEWPMPKRYDKDPTEIHGIKRNPNEGLQAFMDRFKAESAHIKGVPPVLRISTFMHGHGHPELAKKLNDSSGLRKIGSSGERHQARRQEGKGSAKGKEKVINMVRSQGYRKRPYERIEHLMDNTIAFPSVPRYQLTDCPVVVDALIKGFRVRRIHVDGGSSSNVMYEHYFRNLSYRTRSRLKESRVPLVGFSGEEQDLEDHLSIFSAAAEQEEWPMPVWCKMFCQTLSGSARNWFDSLDPKSVDGFEELSNKFLEEFSQQKRHDKDLTEIHDIKRKPNEGLQAFMDHFKAESLHIKGVPPVLRGSASEMSSLGERPILGQGWPERVKGLIQNGEKRRLSTWVRRIHVDGGSSSEVMYEHCFRNLSYRTRSRLKESRETRGRVLGEVSYHGGYRSGGIMGASLPAPLSARKPNSHNGDLRFKSPSPYNALLGRNAACVAYPAPICNNARKWLTLEFCGSGEREISFRRPGSREPMELDNMEERRQLDKGRKPPKSGVEKKIVVNDNYPEQLVTIRGAKKDEEKTAFHTKEGVFCYTKMPFGLKNAWATYQRLVDSAFKEHIGVNLEAYVDDMVIKRPNLEKAKKAVMDMLITKDLKHMQSIMGSWRLNRFLSSQARTDPYLFRYVESLTKKDFRWTEAAEAAFLEMKKGETLMMYLAAANEAVSVVHPHSKGPRWEAKCTIIMLARILCTGRRRKTNFAPDGETRSGPPPSPPAATPPDALMTPTPASFTSLTLRSKRLYTDEASNNVRSIAGLILIAPDGVEYSYTLRLNFSNSNNDPEYEALLAGLWISKEMFQITHIPRAENRKADALSKLAAVQFDHLSKEVLVEVLNERFVKAQENSNGKDCELYDVLYRKSYLVPLMRCVGPLQANYIIREVHMSSCRMHDGPRHVVAKAMNLGNINMSIYGVGMDIVGPLPEGPGRVKYLIVAIDYFTKWMEAKPLATITGKQVVNFTYDNIVCRFGIPAIIITDNETQFVNDPIKKWAEKLKIQLISTSVYHSQGNGAVERANKSLLRRIKTRLEKGGSAWAEEV
ncbi:reverse transcriptase domain-containing protein [Tanacetum coccineum]